MKNKKVFIFLLSIYFSLVLSHEKQISGENIKATNCMPSSNENDTISGYEKSFLRKLRLEDVHADKKLFNDLYFLYSQYDISAYGKDITIEWYCKYKELQFYDNLADSIVVLKNNGHEIKLPIGSLGAPMSLDKRCFVPNTKKKIICVYNPSGGNGWNANSFYVISLEDKYFLENIGEVSDVRDINGDGIDELLKYDDIWELGLGYLCHAEAPGARIILKIEENKIVSDISNNIDYYQDEIKRIDAEIEIFPKKIPQEPNQQLLSLILQKFLIYRLLSNVEKGWEEFNKDIRQYDDKFFYLYDGLKRKKLDNISIDKIINTISNSLREGQKLGELL